MKKILSFIIIVALTISATCTAFATPAKQHLENGLPARSVTIELSDLIKVEEGSYEYEWYGKTFTENYVINYVKEGSTITINHDSEIYLFPAQNDINIIDGIFDVKKTRNNYPALEADYDDYDHYQGNKQYTFSDDMNTSILKLFVTKNYTKINAEYLKENGYKNGSTVYIKLTFSDHNEEASIQNGGDLVAYSYYFVYEIGANSTSNVSTQTAQTKKGVNVVVNGEKINSSPGSFIENGRTLAPLRAIADVLDFKTDWEEETQKITITKNNKTIVMNINQIDFTVNDVAKKFEDVAPTIYDGTTFLPLRKLAEILDLDVKWDEATSTATFTQK